MPTTKSPDKAVRLLDAIKANPGLTARKLAPIAQMQLPDLLGYLRELQQSGQISQERNNCGYLTYKAVA